MRNTKIEWADHTFNPWLGCKEVSPACDHCYARVMANRLKLVQWGIERRRTSVQYWRQPLRWNREAEQSGKRQKIFCGSMCDVFDNQVDESWQADLFDLIHATPWLDWLLLTKRIGNARRHIDRNWGRYEEFPENIWLGITVCNQEEAYRDIPKLLSTPGACKYFLSMEPLLGHVEISRYLHQLSWVIVGGESGPHARPTHPGWVAFIRDQCHSAGIPFFFKQWGEWVDERELFCDYSGIERKKSFRFDGHTTVHRLGKREAGRLLGGYEYLSFPQE